MALEQIEFLSQSRCRFQILEYLLQHDDAKKRDLKTVVESSRTTLQRNLNALESRSWISCEGTSITITPIGRLVVEEFLPLLEAVSMADELADFFRWFPEDDVAFDIRALADATVTVAEDGNPYAAVDQHVAAMKETASCRLLLPVVGLQAMQAATPRLLDDELTLECLFARSGANVLRTDPALESELHRHLESGNVEFYAVNEELPYFVGIYDHCVQIGASDDAGVPRALVESPSEEIRRWAEATFDRFKDGARPFPDAGEGPP